jgi:hypothetical protein
VGDKQWRREQKLLWEAHEKVHAMLDQTRIETREELLNRLDAMNEFRRQLDQQAALFITREMLDTQLVFAERARAELGRNAEAALLRALENIDKRFDVIDQFRAEIGEQMARQPTRAEIRSQNDTLSVAVAAIGDKMNALSADQASKITGLVRRDELEAAQALSAAGLRGLEDRIGDIRSRLDRGEGNMSGQTEYRADQRSGVTVALIGIGVALSFAVGVVSIILTLAHK